MTIEERIAAIDAAIGHGQLMTDDIVHKGSLENKVICGCRTGYKFKMNNLSYRGVWISTLENISLKVDGGIPQGYEHPAQRFSLQRGRDRQ